MPWQNDPDARRRSAATYQDPVYLRNKKLVRQRSGGRCEHMDGTVRCGSMDGVQCDHLVPVSVRVDHSLANLQDLCTTHHQRKTATEGGGFRKQRSDPLPSPRTRW